MAVRVLDSLCHMEAHMATVVMEGDSPEELQAGEVRQQAIAYAGQMGMPRAGIDKEGGAFPVGADGATDEAALNKLATGKTPVIAYRREFTIRSLG